MKIAIVITSLEVGGAEKTVIDTAKLLNKKCRIKLFVIRRNYDSIYEREALKRGIDVTYFGDFLPVFNPFVFLRLRKAMNRFRPDIIHSHLKAADYIYFYRLFGRGDFIWLHTVHTIPQVDSGFIRRLLYRPLYNRKHVKLIAVSDNIKSKLVSLYPRSDITVINNGVDTMTFNYEPVAHPHVTVCHVGRFVPVKNHGYLIAEFRKVLKTYPEAKLILIGAGRLKPKILKYIRRHRMNGNVQLIDCTAKVDYYLKRADIFVLPSLYEGFPLALLEAMACGLIVITSDWGKEVIAHGKNGFIIENKPNRLYMEITAVIDNIRNLEAVRTEAVKTARKFSLKKSAAEILRFYSRVIDDQTGDYNRMS